MFRTVLVHVDTSAEAESRTRLAIGLARQFDATLIGIAAGVPQLPVEVYAAGFGVSTLGSESDEFDRAHVEAEFGKAAEVFRKLTAGAGIETDWRTAFEPPSTAVIKLAAAADLLVLGAERRALLDTVYGPAAGEVVLRVGRPVLVTSNGEQRLQAKNIMIAWKDTPEAQRALADAVPFMKRASRVTLVQVHEGDERPPELDQANAFLVRHGIAAEARTVPQSAGTVVDTLLDFARAEKCDLIVAGAYGHGRLTEWIFGGVTKALLTRSPVPCLLSH